MVRKLVKNHHVNLFANGKTGLKYAIKRDTALANVLLELEKVVNSAQIISILSKAVSGKNEVYEIVDRITVKLGPRFDSNLL